MEFLTSPEMRVADHFMAERVVVDAEQRRLSPGAVCEICFSYFKNDMGLWLHVRWQHSKDKCLVCPVSGCGKRFVARQHQAEHMAHHGVFRQVDSADGNGWSPVPDVARPPTCELCGRLSANGKTLRKHVARVHPQARPYACGVCLLLVRDMSSLACHVRRHHVNELCDDTQRAIRCDVCGQLFGNFTLVRKHRITHSVAFDPTTIDL